ncbi:F-box/kelch-repeat protein At3g06240-like [Cornus florida]|uniref:F-box/kelch-repeat protein At3g06240-like n=1 Tax=Cornus florida TaxID=4283 RepID=UPI0028A1BF19|nr:F-box/kelch-repeat protein At3g06240-like [Cornus florida]
MTTHAKKQPSCLCLAFPSISSLMKYSQNCPSSLLQFRCVSKSWRSLISDPHFIRTHLNQSLSKSNIQTQRILIASLNRPFRFYAGSAGNDHIAESKIDFLVQYNPPRKWQIVGSCNGLICMVANYGHKYICNPSMYVLERFIYVFNPSTRESKQIPNFNPADDIVGFGYDHCSDDYKLVKIHNNSVYAYSLRICSWRKVHDFTYKCSINVYESGTQLNGALHWLCLDDKGHPLEIAIFSLEDEKVWKIPMPTSFTDADEAYELGVFEGCLCILPWFGDAYTYWAMKEYGVNQSWTKLVTRVPFDDTFKPLVLLGNDVALLWIDYKKLVLYNTKEETYRDLMIDDDIEGSYTTIYVESLVSPVMKM